MDNSGVHTWVIVNAYSYRNAGDAAIMIATRDLLRDHGAREVLISTRYNDGEDYARSGISVRPALIPFPERGSASALARLSVLALASLGALATVLVASFSRRAARSLAPMLAPTASRIIASGSVGAVVAGGGYMYSSKRKLNLSLWHSLLTARLASALAANTVMMPQSVGPFTNRFDAMLTSWALTHISVYVRERRSLDYSAFRPRGSEDFCTVPDIAFYRHSPDRLGSPSGSAVARLVVMDWTWSTSVPGSAFHQYLTNMAALADELTRLNWKVVLGGHSSIPEHAQDDLATANRVFALCRESVTVDPDCDVHHLYAVYAEASVTIGTRLHACIMSISSGTPAIALAYQEKAWGVFEEAGLASFVHNAAEFDPMVVAQQAERLRGHRFDRVSQDLSNRIAGIYSEELNG